MTQTKIILGIETSCDEIGISIYSSINGFLSEYTYKQIIHEKYGGVIPELSSKENINKILKIILFTIKKAKYNIINLNAIAFTKGPGLKSSLMIGSSIAKSISYSLKIPCIGVNHLEAHLIITFLLNKNIKFPYLGVLISGAHTMILIIKNINNLTLLEETQDDGAGEVFDKIARAMNLKPYNGMSIERNIDNKIHMAIKTSKNKYNSTIKKLSFSGIKTNTIKIINNNNFNKSNICYKFQNDIIKTITKRIKNVIIKHNLNNIILAGGVASNKELRLSLKEIAIQFKCNLYIPPKKYCTDNGNMIAFLGFLKLKEGFKDKNLKINALSDLKLHQ